jgi:hypothetical protein
MPVEHIATRLAAAGLLTAAGALAIGANQLSALADHLQSAVHKDALRDSIDTDYKADQAEAASRAESDEYPLRPAGDER